MKISNLAVSVWFALICLWASPSYATKFGNQFTEFELPPQWQCNLEGAEWVCQNIDPAKKRDAIIVLAAKIKGDQDSMDQYLTYLKGAKTYTSVQNKQIKSDPKYAKIVNLNGQAWVDSLHLESEIPGFYTRYLATIKEDIGVLVTYSINKAKYQAYLDDFETMVKTLKVFRKAGGVNQAAPQNTNLFADTKIPPGVTDTTVFNGQAPEGGNDQTPQPKPKQEDNSNLYLVIGVAAVGYFLWKKRKG